MKGTVKTAGKTKKQGASVSGAGGSYMEEMGTELGLTEQGKASKQKKMHH